MTFQGFARTPADCSTPYMGTKAEGFNRGFYLVSSAVTRPADIDGPARLL